MKNAKELTSRLDDVLSAMPSFEDQASMVESGTYDDYYKSQIQLGKEIFSEVMGELDGLMGWQFALLFVDEDTRRSYLNMCDCINKESDSETQSDLRRVLRQAIAFVAPEKVEFGGHPDFYPPRRPPLKQLRFGIFVMVELLRKAGFSKERAINHVSQTVSYGFSDEVSVSSERIWDWYDKRGGAYRDEKRLAVAVIAHWRKEVLPVLMGGYMLFAPNQKLVRALMNTYVLTPDELNQLVLLMRIINLITLKILKLAEWDKGLDTKVNNRSEKLDLPLLWKEVGDKMFESPSRASA